MYLKFCYMEQNLWKSSAYVFVFDAVLYTLNSTSLLNKLLSL